MILPESTLVCDQLTDYDLPIRIREGECEETLVDRLVVEPVQTLE